jgi:hypothetical protein
MGIHLLRCAEEIPIHEVLWKIESSSAAEPQREQKPKPLKHGGTEERRKRMRKQKWVGKKSKPNPEEKPGEGRRKQTLLTTKVTKVTKESEENLCVIRLKYPEELQSGLATAMVLTPNQGQRNQDQLLSHGLV